MRSLIVIPARLAATRLPNKPLADIHGHPMIWHVWRRAIDAQAGPVIVAAGDAAIAETIQAAGGRAILTDPHLPSGSDRVWAAAQAFDPSGHYDVIVNLQGDLPMLAPHLLQAVLAPLRDPAMDIATLVAPIEDETEAQTESVVKAVVAGLSDKARPGDWGRALYFSRAAVPWGAGVRWHHIGIYAYRRAALERFVAMPPSLLEKREKLEQLRALEAGMAMAAAVADAVPLGVDTPADLEKIRAQMAR